MAPKTKRKYLCRKTNVSIWNESEFNWGNHKHDRVSIGEEKLSKVINYAKTTSTSHQIDMKHWIHITLVAIGQTRWNRLQCISSSTTRIYLSLFRLWCARFLLLSSHTDQTPPVFFFTFINSLKHSHNRTHVYLWKCEWDRGALIRKRRDKVLSKMYEEEKENIVWEWMYACVCVCVRTTNVLNVNKYEKPRVFSSVILLRRSFQWST